jgi:hypothetical protein
VKHVRKVVVAALAATVAALLALVVVPQATAAAPAAASVPGGSITRAEVLARAQHWYAQGADLPYNQGASNPDPQGRLYRTDCSGYVSMAWHLTSSLNTVSLPGVSHLIAKADLQQGDVLNAPIRSPKHSTGHVKLFVRWAAADKPSFVGYEFGSTPVQYHTMPYQKLHPGAGRR